MPEYKNPYASKEFEKHVERHVKACVDRFSPRVEAVFAAADWKSEWFVGTPYDFFDDLHSVILLKEIVNSWEDEIDEAVTEGLNGDVLTLVRKFVPRGSVGISEKMSVSERGLMSLKTSLHSRILDAVRTYDGGLDVIWDLPFVMPPTIFQKLNSCLGDVCLPYLTRLADRWLQEWETYLSRRLGHLEVARWDIRGETFGTRVPVDYFPHIEHTGGLPLDAKLVDAIIGPEVLLHKLVSRLRILGYRARYQKHPACLFVDPS